MKFRTILDIFTVGVKLLGRLINHLNFNDFRLSKLLAVDW